MALRNKQQSVADQPAVSEPTTPPYLRKLEQAQAQEAAANAKLVQARKALWGLEDELKEALSAETMDAALISSLRSRIDGQSTIVGRYRQDVEVERLNRERVQVRTSEMFGRVKDLEQTIPRLAAALAPGGGFEQAYERAIKEAERALQQAQQAKIEAEARLASYREELKALTGVEG